MRYIKFRAWDKCNETMCEVFDLRLWKDNCWVTMETKEQNPDPHGHIIHFTPEKSEEEIGFGYLMQYTWLLDKNGKEIWEWDVVLIFWITAEVKYSDIWCWWVFFCSQKPKELQELPFYDWTKWNYTECEIIGNVYENPEIL